MELRLKRRGLLQEDHTNYFTIRIAHLPKGITYVKIDSCYFILVVAFNFLCFMIELKMCSAISLVSEK